MLLLKLELLQLLQLLLPVHFLVLLLLLGAKDGGLRARVGFAQRRALGGGARRCLEFFGPSCRNFDRLANTGETENKVDTKNTGKTRNIERSTRIKTNQWKRKRARITDHGRRELKIKQNMLCSTSCLASLERSYTERENSTRTVESPRTRTTRGAAVR